MVARGSKAAIGTTANGNPFRLAVEVEHGYTIWRHD